MDKLAQNDGYAVLATPSGARPAWMSAKYPEVLRVSPERARNLHGHRHNHCFTSPVYREKTAAINRKLAERYKDHPALIVWHVSNEYGGECHCALCQEAFRDWLKLKYENSLDKLNRAWWTGFWSHRYTDWSQIESPAPHGESSVHGLNLDWKRFVTFQTVDFFKNEAAPLREITPDIPITTNLMGTYVGLNYWKFAEELDIISWDNYPTWHTTGISTWEQASQVSFIHDLNRSLKGGKPFMLMESTPSLVNWQQVNKLKRPGMHLLSSLQAVAHGADTVQYFQWRKSRGSSEKLHGAVVDHCGYENTRVFGDVAEVGAVLKKLDVVLGTTVRPDAAIIYDWENRWAIDDVQALKTDKKDYLETCQNHYQALWKLGVPMDVIDMDSDFFGYKLLIAPMLYMVRPGVAERIEQFVGSGGIFVTTYFSGYADENDLCFLGGFPGPLRKVTGIWAEEIDSLYDEERNEIVMEPDSKQGPEGAYEVRDYCELIHTETAETLAAYQHDFYAGRPSLTVNAFGQGKAYYIAARTENRFLEDFYGGLTGSCSLLKALNSDLPCGVTAQLRTDGERKLVFLMNFSEEEKAIDLNQTTFKDLLTGEKLAERLILPPYDIKIMEQ
jgi:beta-galactosidase